MGSIINPISYRLGWSHLWSSGWALSHFSNSKYSFLSNQDLNLVRYIHNMFKVCCGAYFIFSRIRVLRTQYKIFFVLYFNAPLLEWTRDEIDFLSFQFEKLTPRQKALKMKPRRIFKIWRPDLTPTEDKTLKTFLKMFNSFLIKNRLSVEHFRSFIINGYVSSFLNLVAGPAIRTIRNSLASYTTQPIDFIFLRWDVDTLSAPNLALYLRDKFYTYSTLPQVLRTFRYLGNRLMREGLLLGYKIMYTGRFKRLGRRGRATYKWEHKGALPLSATSANISYASIRVRLKYSTCGLKIWLFHK